MQVVLKWTSVESIAFAPQGGVVVATYDESTGAEVNYLAGACVRLHQSKKRISCVACGPQGTFVAAGVGRSVKVWRATDGKPVSQMIVPGWVNQVGFSPDGRLLAATGVLESPSPTRGKGMAALWDLDGASQPNHFTVPLERIRHDCLGSQNLFSMASGLAFAPDGKDIALAAGQQVRIWRGGLTVRCTIRHGARVRAVAYSPDGSLLATAVGGQVFLRDTDFRNTGRPRRILSHSQPIQGFAFLPDGDCLLTAANDRLVRLWNVHTGHLLACYDWKMTSIRAVAVSPDGMIAAAAGDGENALVVWDLD